MKKYRGIFFAFLLLVTLSGCKSGDYKEALELEEAGEYDSALEIFETLEDYKDSSSHVTLCKDMSTAIKEFDSAKSELEEKNDKLDSAVQAARELIQEDKTALDESLQISLETAISETTAAKIEIPDLPDTADEITAIASDMKQANYDEELSMLSDAQTALETSITQYSLVDSPSESYIINSLNLVPTIEDISAATEDNDPNSQLNKAGGYTADVYFSSNLVDQSKVEGKTLINKGTAAGGSIEVYSSVEDAEKRESYLSTFDGTVLASGSHTIVGTVLVRTSDNLTASEQKNLEKWIIKCLTAVPDDVGRAIQFGNYTISLQDYWNEDISTLSENECSYYPGTKGQGVSLVIGCTQDDENSLSLDFLHDNQDEIISALEESNDLEVKKYEDITSNGDVTGIFYQAELNDIEGNGYMFTFPSENENMLYVIVLIESDKSKKDFSDDFLEIIKSIKKAPTSY